MTKIKVCLADDHNLVRDGIKKLLESSGKYEVTVDARHGQELLDLLSNIDEIPSLGLIDVSMPVMEGGETVQELSKHYPQIKAIALSHNDDFENVFRMIDSGARAYLLKDCSPEYLFETLEKVLSDGNHYDSFVMSRIMEHNRQKPAEITPSKEIMGLLNSREIDFIKHCCSEDTYKEIADKMIVSPKTVEGYRVNVFQKTGATTRVGLVIFAMENGLYTPGK